MTLPSKRDAIVAAMPGSITQLRKASGASQPVVDKWVKRLRAEPADSAVKVYLKRWRRTNGQLAAVYDLGNLPDAKKPAAMTQSQYNKRRYKRVKKVKNEARTIRREAVRNAKAMAKVPQTWASALLGVQL